MNKAFIVTAIPRMLLIISMLVFTVNIAEGQDGGKRRLKKMERKARRILYGQASFYANKFHGRKTANGEIFNHSKFTAACNVLPLGTWIRVTNLKNGKTVNVKVNDRLHPKSKRIVDLTKAAAQKLNFISRGLTRVKVEILDQYTHEPIQLQ